MTTINEKKRAPRILIVEDNPGDVLLFRRTLERLRLDVELVVFGSAEAGLADLRARVTMHTGELPDLILTDLNLPGMSGIDLLRVVKGDPSLRRLPCVVFSSSDSVQDITNAYDAQASGYLSKSTSIEAYEQGIRALAEYWFNLMHTADAAPVMARFSPNLDLPGMTPANRLVS